MNATARDEVSSARRAYRQLFELGRGGMARVYLAESLTSGLRKLVVLKVLNPEFCANVEMRASFQREAELSAQMNHPNVVQVMEVVEHAHAPVIVMEYLDGMSLSQLLRKAGHELPLHLHLHVLAQVLAGLHHFHDLNDLDGAPLNAVHRDVSPQNVVVLHDGPVKVLDFGIAKISSADSQVTRAGIIKGKIHYMPPEQLMGDSGVDRRTDVFAVGIMLWEAIAGRRMWEGKTDSEVLRNLAIGTVPQLEEFAPNVPSALLEIVRRATQIDQKNRFQTAREMQVAIERALADEGWFVQPRELAEFMAHHFGQTRREHELEIKAALRVPLGPHLMMSCGPPQLLSPNSSRAEVGTLTEEGRHSMVSRVLRTSQRNWGFALGSAIFLVLGVAWLSSSRPSQALPDARPSQPSTVTLEVEALPVGAEILLNGTLLGKDRVAGPRPYSASKSGLEVKAVGYLTQRRDITLNKDSALQIVLEPDPALAPAKEVAAAPPVAAAASSSTKGRARLVGKPAIASASNKCKPPYTFSADGVKTYKPECF